jgi:hypothetical protein
MMPHARFAGERSPKAATKGADVSPKIQNAALPALGNYDDWY